LTELKHSAGEGEHYVSVTPTTPAINEYQELEMSHRWLHNWTHWTWYTINIELHTDIALLHKMLLLLKDMLYHIYSRIISILIVLFAINFRGPCGSWGRYRIGPICFFTGWRKRRPELGLVWLRYV